MADSDDDAPPPLSSLAEQIDALKLRSQGDESTSGRSDLPQEELLRVANVVVMPAKQGSGQASKPAPSPTLKKGFFDAPPKRKPKPPPPAEPKKPAEEEIPMIRAKKGVGGGGPVIPDFLRVEPDEQEKRYIAMKADLLDKLKPTPDTVSKIGQDPALLAAFDDPEVMAAVNDIAANPQNVKKYKDKPKVRAFYEAMGKLMGDKLQSASPSPGAAPAATQRPM
ncbi:hypothetical protein PLESTB_000493800 [Pleodorina starrii]|uniref:STI1/HOP DP domain-containing protein n=1 Tax=Pleodorina starrii TaxID=330485 RepID=A0A9W6EZS1_9CHLO|nr:hypothetical protein PLESTM_000365300 [Pleodorina starrii]GLC51358.1 hypothetical protein PLESTB_000493800 [Pleodorina starrii]GLC63723.1 hypothetical protein PLESTF_000067300 [Pleodorina starrii]